MENLPPARIRLVCVLLISLVSACVQPAAVPRAEDGLLDLREVDLSQGAIALSGEWQLYTDSLLRPGSNARTDLQPETIEVPGIWNDDPGLPAWGIHTYHLRILLPPDSDLLALRMPSILSAYELYVDGQLLDSVGRVAQQASHPGRASRLVFLPSSTGEEIEILLPVANHDYRKGGIDHPVSIGQAGVVSHIHRMRGFLDVFLAGSILIMALHHLALFLFRREDAAPLLFGLFCVSVVLRLLTTGEVLLETVFPGFSYELARAFEFSPFFFGGVVFLMYAARVFPQESSRLALNLIKAFSILFGVAVLLLPTRLHNHLVVPMELMAVAGLGVMLAQIVRAARHRRPGAGYFVVGVVLIFAATLNDVLRANMIIRTVYLIPVGMYLFIFSQSLLLAQSSSRNLHERRIIERQKREIEDKNSEIIDSITYTKRIQESFLPAAEQVDRLLGEQFIIWQPRDIVGGDIYYLGSSGGKQYLCVLDCTGHGVPGAFLTTVTLAILERILIEQPGGSPAVILAELNYRLQRRLHQHMHDSRFSDGADGVLLCFDPERPDGFSFSGARMGAYLLQNGTPEYLRGDRISLGCRRSAADARFREHRVAWDQADWVYLATDGYMDQSGGEKGYSLGRRGFLRQLQACAGLAAGEQRRLLLRQLCEYRGAKPQRDDIAVIGFSTAAAADRIISGSGSP